jgi:hypothetical protein
LTLGFLWLHCALNLWGEGVSAAMHATGFLAGALVARLPPTAWAWNGAAKLLGGAYGLAAAFSFGQAVASDVSTERRALAEYAAVAQNPATLTPIAELLLASAEVSDRITALALARRAALLEPADPGAASVLALAEAKALSRPLAGLDRLRPFLGSSLYDATQPTPLILRFAELLVLASQRKVEPVPPNGREVCGLVRQEAVFCQVGEAALPEGAVIVWSRPDSEGHRQRSWPIR